jgi:hypothetical protein
MSPLRALAGVIASTALATAPIPVLAEPSAVIAPPASNAGTVTSVATGMGLTGGPVTSTGTISLTNPCPTTTNSGDFYSASNTTGGCQDSGYSASSLQSVHVELGSLHNANMNSTADQSITLTCPTAGSQCVVTSFIFWGCNGTPSSAQGAFYTGASKSGYTFFAGGATSPMGALGSGTLAAVGESSSPTGANAGKSLEVVTGSPVTINFALTTAQGSPMTCNIAVMADVIS